MPAPSLRIPVGANLDEFKKAMNETSSLAKTATRKVAQTFLDMNSEIAATAGAASARWALAWVGKIALVVGAMKLMGDTVSAVRGQLEQMVDIADKSANTGFSPEMWQSWVAGAKGAEKQVDAFEGALQNAFQALKPVLNPNWSVWDDGLKKVTAVEEAMRGMRELFSTDQDFSGFQMFRDAKNQDQQVEAVLVYMKQLQAIGQSVAAIDLGEKLFGAGFADKIRTNQLSIDQLLDNIRTKSPDAFSNEIVQRAKELDDRLNDAWHTISKNLHPSMETLDSIALSLKAVWVEIVELMARGSKLLNPNLTGTNTVVGTLSATGEPGFQTPISDGSVTQDQKITPDATRVEITGGTTRIPLPRRRPTDAPQPPKTEGAQTDRFQTSAESIERRVAALKAEAQALDLGAGARDKSRIAAQLETVAMQANAAAGLGANVVTEEQRKRITDVAEAYGKASEAMERAKIASSISFDRQTAFLTNEDVAIAQALRGIYGNDVPAALASTEAAAMRTTNTMRELNSLGADINRGMFIEFGQNLRSGQSIWEAWGNAGLNALGRVADKLSAMAADKLWESALGGSSGIGRLFGLGSTELPGWGSSSFVGPMKADGGMIRGPGTGTSDSIPAMLSDGEFVIRSSVVSQPGVLDHLERLNSGRMHFADGGLAARSATASSPPAAAGAIHIDASDNRTVTINGGDQASVGQIKQELAADRAMRKEQVIAIVAQARKERRL